MKQEMLTDVQGCPVNMEQLCSYSGFSRLSRHCNKRTRQIAQTVDDLAQDKGIAATCLQQ